MVGALGSYSNASAANLSIRCDSPKDIRAWAVEANGVNSISAEYHNTYNTFAITNIPIGANCTWAKVTLDGQPAVSDDGQGNSQWGMHQPATNNQLHFAVTPASQMAAGVFPVKPITNTTYTYDSAGQLTSRTGTNTVSYAYDAARNLTRCWSGTTFTNFYQYDHARRLVKETHTCTGVTEISWSYVYEGLDVVAKVDNLTGDLIYFTRGLGVAPGVGDVLAESHIASNGSLKCTYLYVQNHRGDTIALVSNSTVVARYEYSAWGVPEPLNPEPSAAPFFTFSGKHFDSDAGLYYYGFRWYDPQAKTWTQPDPSGLAEGLDLYQFCGNDPVNGVDVYGEYRVVFVGDGWTQAQKDTVNTYLLDVLARTCELLYDIDGYINAAKAAGCKEGVKELQKVRDNLEKLRKAFYDNDRILKIELKDMGDKDLSGQYDPKTGILALNSNPAMKVFADYRNGLGTLAHELLHETGFLTGLLDAFKTEGNEKTIENARKYEEKLFLGGNEEHQEFIVLLLIDRLGGWPKNYPWVNSTNIKTRYPRNVPQLKRK